MAFRKLLFLLLLPAVSLAQSNDALETVSQYFDAINKQSSEIISLFHGNSTINTIVYDTNGLANLKVYKREDFDNVLQETYQFYTVTQEPVVLFSRGYGYSNGIYSSVLLRFIDQNNDTILSRSIQSFKLAFIDGSWKIDQLTIQNEIPGIEFEAEMWPEELLSKFNLSNKESKNAKPSPTTEFETYDENKVYKLSEVDEPPVYPLGEDALKQLMESYQVKTDMTESEASQLGFSKFLVTIGEDGLTSEYYLNDLSSDQLARAQSFIRSMMVWYPAIESGASVQCKILFYIQ